MNPILPLAVFLIAAWASRALFTTRALILAGGGMLAHATGSFLGWPSTTLLQVFVLYNGLFALAAVVDYLSTARPRSFSVLRRQDEVLSLGTGNLVQLEVSYHGGHRTMIILRDEPPPCFVVTTEQTATELAPGGSAILSYHVVPPRRGLFQFGRIHLRYRGRLGLIARQTCISAQAEVKVYPDVLAVKRFELLARTGRLPELGLKAARLKGASTNFESVREYVAGDEYRRINWPATARRGRPQSNEYQLEQSQNVFILMDTGRIMMTKAGKLARLDYAINAALMLAYVAAGRGDYVGAMAFADEIHGYLVPGKGKGQVNRCIEFLYPLQPVLVESDYAGAFTYFASRNRKRSLVCVFTDLIDEEISRLLLAHLSFLAPAHLPLCVTLRDPEVDRAVETPVSDPASVYTKAVAEQIMADRTRARRFLERRGVLVVDVPPAEMSVAVVDKYVELKERGRL